MLLKREKKTNTTNAKYTHVVDINLYTKKKLHIIIAHKLTQKKKSASFQSLKW